MPGTKKGSKGSKKSAKRNLAEAPGYAPAAAPAAAEPTLSESSYEYPGVLVLPAGYSYLKLQVVIDDPSLGIGIGLDNDFNITEIKPDGPGELAGLRLDDQLVEVNETSILGSEFGVGHDARMRLGELLGELMAGDGPCTLHLGLRRPPQGALEEPGSPTSDFLADSEHLQAYDAKQASGAQEATTPPAAAASEPAAEPPALAFPEPPAARSRAPSFPNPPPREGSFQKRPSSRGSHEAEPKPVGAGRPPLPPRRETSWSKGGSTRGSAAAESAAEAEAHGARAEGSEASGRVGLPPNRPALPGRRESSSWGKRAADQPEVKPPTVGATSAAAFPPPPPRREEDAPAVAEPTAPATDAVESGGSPGGAASDSSNTLSHSNTLEVMEMAGTSPAGGEASPPPAGGEQAGGEQAGEEQAGGEQAGGEQAGGELAFSGYAAMMEEGMAANAAHEYSVARDIFRRCYTLSNRAPAGVSAANMSLKLGDAAEAANEYSLIMRLHSATLPEKLAAHVKFKMGKAQLAALVTSPSDDEVAAVVRIQSLTRGGIARKSGPTPADAKYSATVKAANDANAASDYLHARDLFLDAYCLRGHLESRLSAANMTLKLGCAFSAKREFDAISKLQARLGPRGGAILARKISEAAAACANRAQPSIQLRALQVPYEEKGTRGAARRITTQLVAVEDTEAEGAEREGGSGGAGTSAADVAGGWEMIGDDEVELATAAAQEAVEVEAVTRLQAFHRGSAGRDQLRASAAAGRSTSEYDALLNAAAAADRSADFKAARDVYLHAYELSGKVEPRLAAVNMRLRMGQVAEAIGEYEALLADDGAAPGLLTNEVKQSIHSKLTEARTAAARPPNLVSATAVSRRKPAASAADDWMGVEFCCAAQRKTGPSAGRSVNPGFHAPSRDGAEGAGQEEATESLGPFGSFLALFSSQPQPTSAA